MCRLCHCCIESFPLVLKMIITSFSITSFFKRLVSSEEALDIDKQFWKTFQKFSGEVSERVCFVSREGRTLSKDLHREIWRGRHLPLLQYNCLFFLVSKLFPAITSSLVFSAYAFFTY